MKFVLILTFAVNAYTGSTGSGMGGVATAVFEDEAACQNAANKWKSQFSVLKPNSNEREFSVLQHHSSASERKYVNAVCVPQSSGK